MPRAAPTPRLAAALAALAAGGAADAAACAAPPALAVPAPERDLRIETPDGAIAATYAGPAGVPPRARVVLLHGYTGARDEILTAAGEGLFARAARAFARAGIASLRIDALGSGESDGAWAETTFSGQARDARRALAHLEVLSTPVESAAPTALLGYSQGGLVALRAGAVADRLVLWNPVLDPCEVYARILGADTLAEGRRRHALGERDVVGDSGLRPAFFAEVAATDPLADAVRLAASILVVAGASDRIARDGPALAHALAAQRAAPTEVVLMDSGHDLGAVSDLATLDAVIGCAAAFLLDPAANDSSR